MNKFSVTLGRSAKNISKERAARLSNGAERAQRNIVDGIRASLEGLEERLENHNDISTLVHSSNTKNNVDFDSINHMREMHDIKLQLVEKSVELEVAISTYEEWFTEPKKTTKAKA